MPTIKLDDNGDIDLSDNTVTLIDGSSYVQQTLLTTLRTFKGECFLNLNFGIPYFQEIFTKNIPLSRVESIFKENILKVDGVIELLKFNLSFTGTNRELLLNFTVKSSEGEIIISEVLS